jgi:DNA ligase-1
MLKDYPVHVRFYDALEIGGEDLRGLPFTARRQRLEDWHGDFGPAHSDLSEVLSFDSKEALKARWEGTREEGIEGLMLKRKDSPYLAGRPKGHWYKWKRAALTADCVLLYAQKGSGKRSSFYSDYTFGAWTEKDGQPFLVPVGKAYSGFTDEELVQLDRFIRQNTIDRFGPVRSVTPKLVLEVAFDAIQPSTRHKSGIAMRFPRISRIRWDKPAGEADTLETLKALIV